MLRRALSCLRTRAETSAAYQPTPNPEPTSCVGTHPSPFTFSLYMPSSRSVQHDEPGAMDWDSMDSWVVAGVFCALFLPLALGFWLGRALRGRRGDRTAGTTTQPFRSGRVPDGAVARSTERWLLGELDKAPFTTVLTPDQRIDALGPETEEAAVQGSAPSAVATSTIEEAVQETPRRSGDVESCRDRMRRGTCRACNAGGAPPPDHRILAGYVARSRGSGPRRPHLSPGPQR